MQLFHVHATGWLGTLWIIRQPGVEGELNKNAITPIDYRSRCLWSLNGHKAEGPCFIHYPAIRHTDQLLIGSSHDSILQTGP